MPAMSPSIDHRSSGVAWGKLTRCARVLRSRGPCVGVCCCLLLPAPGPMFHVARWNQARLEGEVGQRICAERPALRPPGLLPQFWLHEDCFLDAAMRRPRVVNHS
jgi:hypothetical protein